MGIIWSIFVGFFAGLIARWITPGDHKPSGFILTTVLGIVGSLVATFLGQQIGLYDANDGAGFIGAVVGAVIVLLVWSQLARRA
ncbi:MULTISPECIES: GlsB/YeaQ/YmgE family stress response membrane protein [unclassified Devosia]|uniref:GlsB/YeaQ/YmgE family stress response membrane protein n=1 Tax=unclassified Devosia TaxID=196773 RepID=UPI000FDB112B|nr:MULTISPECIES: GlsB/YeaQ/YmgE family stress response membrane protein [unclassified Devosia]